MNRVKQSGFTLIEALLTVAIIGILLTVAYPSYRDNIERGDRALARAGLVSLSNSLEQYYAENNSYTGATMANVAHPTTVPLSGGTAVYTLSLTITDSGGVYILSAIPIAASTGSTIIYTLRSTGERRSGAPLSISSGWQD